MTPMTQQEVMDQAWAKRLEQVKLSKEKYPFLMPNVEQYLPFIKEIFLVGFCDGMEMGLTSNILSADLVPSEGRQH